jgi:flagellar basal body-associated protein FliL
VVDILGSLGLAGFKVGALGTLGTILLWFLIVIFIFAIVGGGIILWIWNKSYNQIAELWAKVNGVDQVIATYKAKWIRLPGTTKRLLFVRSANRWESPQYLTGKNIWKFHRRAIDGQWHNFKHGSVDEKLNEMGIEIVQGDVRMQSEANEKILRDRLQKKKDWMAIITQIAYIITFILIFIALVVLFSKLTNVAEAQGQTAQAMTKMAESIEKFYTNKIEGQSPEDINRGDTGILKPVNITT